MKTTFGLLAVLAVTATALWAAEPPAAAAAGAATNSGASLPLPALAAPQPAAASSGAEGQQPPISPSEANPPVMVEPPADLAAAPAPSENGEGLRLNFRGAPLESVLNYLSEAAGFIIVLDTQPRGKVDVWSNQPLNKEEAVDLLNSVLNKNGYAVIRKGRKLTVVNKDEAKIKGIPVKSGSDPEAIPDNDEIVTQIIPVQFVEVAQLLKDLQPLVSSQTAMTGNESGNSIVITDTQSNIRRVAEIIRAIDMGAEDVTSVRVFRLEHSDPNEISELLTSLFPDDSRSGGGSQSPIQFGGMSRLMQRFGGGPPGGSRGGSSNSAGQNQRIKKRARVLAVPDPRTGSVVVSCSKDLMEQIEQVIAELDSNPARQQTVKVFPLQNAEPQEALQVLQDIFQKSGTQNNNRNTANQTSTLQTRQQQQNQQNNSMTRSSNGNRSSRGMGSFGQ